MRVVMDGDPATRLPFVKQSPSRSASNCSARGLIDRTCPQPLRIISASVSLDKSGGRYASRTARFMWP